MKKHDNGILYSPSDLITFLESPFASWMDRWYLEDPQAITPDKLTESEQSVTAAGDRHEEEQLYKFRNEGWSIAEISMSKDVDLAEALTDEALASDHDMIFQARLRGGAFAGWADFMVRDSEDPTRWEIWDAKLARKMKSYFIIQLCAYADMLEQMTGQRPLTLRVLLGTGKTESFRTEDYYDYYLELKERFLTFMEFWQADLTQRPVPDPSAEHRRWSSHAEEWLNTVDHLSLVARISKGQREHLENAGIRTLAALAEAKDTDRPKRIAVPIFERLREQAALQKSTRERRAVDPDAIADYNVLQAAPDRPDLGLGALPPADPADLFFDLEGYPLIDGGLEYLWGVTYLDSGKRHFKDWWAHDSQEEKAAFEGFIDWAYARWRANPGLHIYHYANYEIAVLKRLMSRYGSREEEVDDLLRNGVFVDLYKVVKEGLRVGEPSYSIKYIERLYRPQRTNEVATAGESIVQYANWLNSGQGTCPATSAILREIRDYNQDDCDSTQELADWLRGLQRDERIYFHDPKTEEDDASSYSPADSIQEAIARKKDQQTSLDQFKKQAPDEGSRRLATLLSDFVGFYRRDAKPIWWRLFDRLASTDEELKEDIACIGDAVLASPQGEPFKQSLLFEYTFDPGQDTKVRIGDKLFPTFNHKASVEVYSIDTYKGTVTLKISRSQLQKSFEGEMPPRTSFIPKEFVSPGVLETSLNEQIDKFSETGEIHPALRQLLLREAPPSLAPFQQQDAQARALQTALRMKGELLCIQGPPGTGKSTTAATIIADLIGQGHSVGISGSSHKAILSLIRKIAEKMGTDFSAVYKGNSTDNPDAEEIAGLLIVKDNGNAFSQFDGTILAGTAWLFAREEAEGLLDYLFVDEAGQVGTANLIAMAPCARNLILLGDQMQLEQVSQAVHPGMAGDSCLNYFLGGERVIPESQGIFLPISYRMQTDLCKIVSEIAYEGKLKSKGTDHRKLVWPEGNGALHQDRGILFHPIEHTGNVQASEEEVQEIVALTKQLLKANLQEKETLRPLGIDDILFVAPYNMQVNLLRSHFPEGAKVASVDKFQGQEAPVVILSMCSSFGEYGSRGIEFILNRNRLNVALSRAQTLAIVVGDPRISTTPSQSIPRIAELSTYANLKRS